MKIVKKLFILVLLGFCSSAIFAKTISLLSCQKTENTNTIINVINNVETGVMDVLFNSGHIVTSEKPIIEKNSKDIYDKILNTYKFETSVQYLIYIEYTFDDDQEAFSYNNLININWTLVRVSDKNIVAKKTKKITNKLKDINENKETCQNLGKQVALEINNVIMNDINREG
ncbi:MAG: hypothetical protein BKP49_08905 [Treponema sp. CETP13]|nr:MAG: hypothetical protein BKP49_08905 [Treponema sp. CETP13]